MTAEIKSNGKHGGPFLALGVLGLVACVACFIYAAVHAAKLGDAGPGNWGYVMAVCGISAVGFVLILVGLRAVSPNTGKVISLFGDYVGTLKEPGLWWVNPFTKATNISLRTRNMVTPTIKVNDIRGNPIEIAAVVVWRVVDTAAASFDVDNFNSFVDTQCESALRHLASTYPYDTGETHETSLRGSTEEVSRALEAELQERVKRAGVTIEETRLSHLAYAPEIA
ncbi:MAG: SPFH domain-containing protein, partial [Planctomycetota bacterium]|nr:SPFH domain-containing protein [Planctomycetota bacterium]